MPRETILHRFCLCVFVGTRIDESLSVCFCIPPHSTPLRPTTTDFFYIIIWKSLPLYGRCRKILGGCLHHKFAVPLQHNLKGVDKKAVIENLRRADKFVKGGPFSEFAENEIDGMKEFLYYMKFLGVCYFQLFVVPLHRI